MYATMSKPNSTARFTNPEAQKAYDDLWRRTLARISGDLNRFIYLASTRDYNSGRHHHAGLEGHFGYEAVRQALETAHRELFWKLTRSSLEDLVEELELYMRSSGESPDDLLRTWRTLQPYRVAIPLEADPTAVHLLLANLRLGLEVLQKRRSAHAGGS
jgi:hypothetical protein